MLNLNKSFLAGSTPYSLSQISHLWASSGGKIGFLGLTRYDVAESGRVWYQSIPRDETNRLVPNLPRVDALLAKFQKIALKSLMDFISFK